MNEKHTIKERKKNEQKLQVTAALALKDYM